MRTHFRQLLGVCLSSCFFLVGHAASPQEKAPPTNATGGGHSVVMKSVFDGLSTDTTLRADNVLIGSKKRAKELSETISKELSKEDLLYPAVELYGEDSWTPGSVNPFAGRGAVEIPDTFMIDCSMFSHPLERLTRVTSRYGYRKRFKRMHYGIDLNVNVGDTVRAAFDGKVRIVSYEGRGYGHYIVMRHPNGLETVYAHLSRPIARPNQVFRAGEAIGLAGNTGRSTGPHLHFETRFMGVPINPESIIDFGNGIPRQQNYVFLRKRHGIAKTTVAAAARPAKVSRTSAIVTYKVRKGDTLSKIAARYGMSVGKLRKLNGMSSASKIRVGQPLRVSS